MSLGFFKIGLFLVVLLPIQLFAQPGQVYGTLSIDVVDAAGKPVRGAHIKESPVRGGAMLRRAFPPLSEINFSRQFKPRDAAESSFVATTYCLSRQQYAYALSVSADGYDPVEKDGEVHSCQESVKIVLKRNNQSLPDYEALSEIKGRLTDHSGKPVTDRFSIFGSTEYVPKISETGEYSARLPVGVYHILFNPIGCTEYQIRNIRIDEDPKTLDLKVDCQLTQMRPDPALMRQTN